MKAAEHLADILAAKMERGAWPAERRLPTVRSIAAAWKISPVTALETLRILRRRGLIVKYPGRSRYFLSRNFDPESKISPVERAATSRSLRIAERIKGEVMAGAYTPGDFLPYLKELRKLFSCSFATMSKVMRILREGGWIEEKGRRYVLARGAKGVSPDSQISHIHLAGSRQIATQYHGQVQNFISSVRLELRRLRWGELKFHLSDTPLTDPAPENHHVGGYILVRHGLQKGWGSYLRKKPAIPLVYVDLQEQVRGNYAAHKRFVRIFPSNAHAGREVGLHLRSLDHHRIAFLTHHPLSLPWALKRLEGLEENFPSRGKSGRGQLTVFDGSAAIRSASGSPRSVHQSLSGLSRAFGKDRFLLPDRIKEAFASLFGLETLWQTARAMQPLFEKAFADKTLTAWVCINDELAETALAFLKRRKAEVPGDISVVGFDNSPVAYGSGLTSFDFALDEMGYAAVRCLEKPETMRGHPQGILRVPGHLQMRDSSGPCRT